MPRFIFVSDIGGIVYADTKDQQGPEHATPLEALRAIDEGIGEGDLVYTEVARDAPDASLHVFRSAGTVRVVERDAVYVTSIRVEAPKPAPSAP